MANPTGQNRPEPTSLKMLKGDGDGRDSGGRPIKQPPAFGREGLDADDAPEVLKGVGAEMWVHVCTEMDGLDILKRLDRESLTDGCLIWQRLMDARSIRLSRRENGDPYLGICIEDSKGIPKVAPWVKAEEVNERAFRLWCIEYGMTPAAEVKLAREVSAGADTDENPFAAAG